MAKEVKYQPAVYENLSVGTNYAHDHETKGRTYPVRIHGKNPGGYPLTREEARAFADMIYDILDDKINQGCLVQVQILGEAAGRGMWTYRDPGFDLKVDDLVRVPFGYNNLAKVAIVRSLTSAYTGAAKDVSAKFTAEEL